MWSIGKLAQQCGLHIETIRYYQRIGLLRVPEKKGSYRYYQQHDLETLNFIQNGKDAGLSLNEIQELLHLKLQDHIQVRDVIEQRLAKIDQRLRELQSLKQRLNRWLLDCKSNHQTDCPILKALQSKQEN